MINGAYPRMIGSVVVTRMTMALLGAIKSVEKAHSPQLGRAGISIIGFRSQNKPKFYHLTKSVQS